MVGFSIDRFGAYRAEYRSSTERASEAFLNERILQYEAFMERPIVDRVFRHLTLRAPNKVYYDWAKLELEIREMKTPPPWFTRDEAFRNS